MPPAMCRPGRTAAPTCQVLDRNLRPVSGLFAAGDCRAKSVRQLTTAAADGTVAALAACTWVDEHPAAE